MRTTLWSENLRGRDYSEDLGLDGNRSYGNKIERCGLDPSDSECGPVAGSCEYGDEPLGSIKGG